MSLLKEKLELKLEEAEFTTQQSLSRFSALQKKFFLVGLLGIIPMYFIAQYAGNYYFAKAYRTYLISAKPSYLNSQSLIIDRIDIASLGNNEYAIVGQVNNPNLDLATKQVPYEWVFFDAKAQITAPSQSGKLSISPNEKKYLILPVVKSLSPIAKAEIRFLKEPVWQKKINVEKLSLITSQPKGYDQTNPFGYVLEGEVYNNSPYLIKEIKLNFILLGLGGKIIGASYRSEFDLLPKQKRSYKHFWPEISGKNIVKAETIVETDLLNKDNLKIPESESNNNAGFLGR